jgi:hypothetical protein
VPWRRPKPCRRRGEGSLCNQRARRGATSPRNGSHAHLAQDDLSLTMNRGPRLLNPPLPPVRVVVLQGARGLAEETQEIPCLTGWRGFAPVRGCGIGLFKPSRSMTLPMAVLRAVNLPRGRPLMLGTPSELRNHRPHRPRSPGTRTLGPLMGRFRTSTARSMTGACTERRATRRTSYRWCGRCGRYLARAVIYLIHPRG